MKGSRKLVPETMGKHTGRSDLLFIEKMMRMDE